LLYSPDNDPFTDLMDERVALAKDVLDYAWRVMALKREGDGERSPLPALIAFTELDATRQ
jgi:hypothetical protein